MYDFIQHTQVLPEGQGIQGSNMDSHYHTHHWHGCLPLTLKDGPGWMLFTFRS